MNSFINQYSIQLLILAALIAVVSATTRRLDHQSQPASSSWNQQQQEDQQSQIYQDEHQHSGPNYSYGYSVRDDWSGDWKSQHESRHGDRVRGQYRMLESDGTERIVDYSADERNGFKAIVRNEPKWHFHPVPVEFFAIKLKPVDVVAASEHRQHRENNKETASSMHIYQHYSQQPWMISSKVRHN